MACTGLQPSLRRLVLEASRTHEIHSFLAPSIAPSRRFSATTGYRSRIGKAAITIPPDVSLRFCDVPRTSARSRNPDAPVSILEVTGPLGQLTLPIPQYLSASQDSDGKKLNVSVLESDEIHQRSMWGTMRALIQNTISGVSEGHTCILRLVGVGYRATVEETAITKKPEYPGQKFVNLKLGFAHPVEMGVPLGVKASTPQPTRILLEGCNKQVVTQFAAEIRRWRKPEPYKGKGIFVNDETIKLKGKNK